MPRHRTRSSAAPRPPGQLASTAARAEPDPGAAPRGVARVPERWRGILLALAIVVAGAVAYAPVVDAGFVFDDHSVVEHSTLLRGPLSDIWFSAGQKDYWPLTYTVLWVQWRLWGGDPTGYHVVNVALHLAAALLLWRVLLALRVPGAWLAGLLFALHPVGVESAAWISEHKNTLSAALFLAAIWAWVRHERDGQRTSYAAALLAFAAALLAKTSVVMGPFVLLALRVRKTGRRPGLRDALALAPFFALSLATGLATLWFQHHQAMAGAAESGRGLVERLGGAGWALLAYLQQALVPIGLSLVYADWPVESGSPAFYLPAAAVVVLALLLWRGRAGPAAPALPALAYHALMLVPVLGLVEIAYFRIGPISNHLQYLSLMGPVALVAFALSRLAERARAAGAAAAAAIALAFGVTTFARASAFEDDLTLWRAAVESAPRSAAAHSQLAALLAEADRMPEAIQHLREAERTARDPDGRLRAQAYAALYSGETLEAARAARALAESRDADMRRDGALVLAAVGGRPYAIELLRGLVRENPASSDYAYWLAALLAQSGGIEEASSVLRAWCTQRPGNPRMEQAFAFTLVRLGAMDEARRRAAAVLGLRVDHPEVAAQLDRWMAQAGWRPASR